MNEEALANLSNRMQNDFYVGVVGSVRSGIRLSIRFSN